MVMRSLAMLLLIGMPLAAADGPAGVLQTAPTGKLLTDLRAAAKIVAGDRGSMAIDNGLKEWLGETGFTGLDLTKPLLGYMLYDDKDATKTSFVLLAGITEEKDFLDFLERAHLKPVADEKVKGLYRLGSFDIPAQAGNAEAQPFVVNMRLDGTTAYIGFNVPGESLDPAKVYKADKLFDATETALLVFKQYNDRMPPEVMKNATKTYEDAMKNLKDELAGLGIAEKGVLEAAEKLMNSVMKMNMEAKESGTRLTLNTTSGELGIDSYYVPKAGSEFAKLIAERKPTVNQFGALANNTTAAGVMLQFPIGIKEVQDLLVVGLEKGQEEMKKDPPPPFLKDVVDETMLGLIRTVKSGTMDFAITMNGPDKDGHFVAAAGFSFDNAIPVEKAIKANFKDFPAQATSVMKLDVDKIGAINIHAIDPPAEGEPEGYSQLFGDRKVYFAFGPKGVYAAVGNGAKDSLKTMLNSKPTPANAFDILANPKRLGQAITTVAPQAGAMAEQVMGTEDKTYSCYTLSISGGDSLKMKFSLNLKILPRWIAYTIAEAR